MAVSMKQVRAFLDAEEPDYRGVAELGPDALPHLKKLVGGTDVMLASKAAYAASLIPDERAVDVLLEAAQSEEPVVRVAAATAVRNMPELASGDLLENFFVDDDAGVRRAAIKSVGKNASGALRSKITKMASSDSDPAIREMSRAALNRLTDADEAESSSDEAGMGGGTLQYSRTAATETGSDGDGGGSLEGATASQPWSDSDGQGEGGGELSPMPNAQAHEVEGFGGGSLR
jgi:HEAT repeat protein